MRSDQVNKRRQKDIMNLALSKYDVQANEENGNELFVTFAGPKDSCYEGVKLQ